MKIHEALNQKSHFIFQNEETGKVMNVFNDFNTLRIITEGYCIKQDEFDWMDQNLN